MSTRYGSLPHTEHLGGLALHNDYVVTEFAGYTTGSTINVIQVLRWSQREFDFTDNVGRSLAVNGTSDTIVRASLTSTETDGLSWEVI